MVCVTMIFNSEEQCKMFIKSNSSFLDPKRADYKLLPPLANDPPRDGHPYERWVVRYDQNALHMEIYS